MPAALATSLSLNTAGTAVILCCNCGFMTAKKNHTAGCVNGQPPVVESWLSEEARETPYPRLPAARDFYDSLRASTDIACL